MDSETERPKNNHRAICCPRSLVKRFKFSGISETKFYTMQLNRNVNTYF